MRSITLPNTNTIRLRFEEFIANPTRDALLDMLVENNFGEFSYIDYKAEWPLDTKLAKQALALGNTGGGCLVVGIAETKDENRFDIKGVKAIEDKSDVRKKIQKFIPDSLVGRIEIIDLSMKVGRLLKNFQLFIVSPDSKDLPYISKKNGTDIFEGFIYVRRGEETTQASHEEVQRILRQRVEGRLFKNKAIDLNEHLTQLKILYAEVPDLKSTVKLSESAKTVALIVGSMAEQVFTTHYEENPHRPEESYVDFIHKMIQLKKQIIEVDIGG